MKELFQKYVVIMFEADDCDKSGHNPSDRFIQYRNNSWRVLLKDYIEERAISIANYIIENNATVRQTAKAFGISKSTVHVEVTK